MLQDAKYSRQPDQENAMVEKVLLKKYANRRLYDTQQSKYVTLSEVAQQIRSGQQVEVVDAKSKQDVTAFILSQIIMEEARSKNILLPVPLLHLIIQYGDNVLLEFFEKHLQQTIQGYLAHKRSVDEQFKKWLDMGMDFSEMAQKSLSQANPLQNIFEQFSNAPQNGKKKGR
jgi:polyhydroxyalkanoate synthesis repressor PhaR